MAAARTEVLSLCSGDKKRSLSSKRYWAATSWQLTADLAEDFLDEKLVKDIACASLRRAITFCRENLRTLMKIEGFEAESSLEILEAIMREELAIAFAHR